MHMHADMYRGMTDYPIIKEVRGKLEGRKIGNHFCYHLPGLADIPLYGTVYGTNVHVNANNPSPSPPPQLPVDQSA